VIFVRATLPNPNDVNDPYQTIDFAALTVTIDNPCRTSNINGPNPAIPTLATTVKRATAEEHVFGIDQHSAAVTYGFDKCGDIEVSIESVVPLVPSAAGSESQFYTLSPLSASTSDVEHTISISTTDEDHASHSYTLTLLVALSDYKTSDSREARFTFVVQIGKCYITAINGADLTSISYTVTEG
jgi:hypothetical protein